MSSYNYIKPGLSNAGSYQVSGIPWASSSLTAPASGSTPLEISFPYVTKSIVIKNITTSNVNIKVGFSQNGVIGTNYFLLGKGESFAEDLRVAKLYVITDSGSSGSLSIVCGLTGIPAADLQHNWSGSAGIG